MNRTRHAISYVCRCRKALVPLLPSQTSNLNKCLSVPDHRRLFSSLKNGPSCHNIEDIFPKLPIKSPPMFAMDVANRLFKQVSWTVDNQLSKDDILNTNAAAEKILMFVTECLVNNEFEVLEEKLSEEALQKARSIALAESNDKCLIFEGTSNKLFASENRFFAPWVSSSEDNCFILTYLALMASQPRQSVWGITLVIEKDRDGGISEELKVTDLYFETKLLSSD